MLFSINIARDFIDNIWGWGNLAGTVLIPVLIWYYGSSRAEAKKINEQQNEHLNYLIMLIDRYFQYLQTLEGVITSSVNNMSKFIIAPSEERKMDAFHSIVPPILDFDLKISNYAFTINKQPDLIKLLMKFLTLYDELQIHIKHYNNDAMHVYNPEIPMESFVKTAIGYRDLNFQNFLATIWLSQYILRHLFETVYKYEKYLKKSHLIASYIPPEGVAYYEHIIIKLNNLYGNETWQDAYKYAIEPVKINGYKKIYESFVNKIFRKKAEANPDNAIPFPINWMMDFVKKHPLDSHNRK